MKVLVLVAHPALPYSRVNRTWINRLQKYPEITVYNLYDKYPDGIIDIYQEQELLLSHDRIVFQFPLFFFNVPYMLKKWQDEVLSFLWSGEEGTKLYGKELMLAVSIGAPRESYKRDGFNKFTIEELTRPLQAMANLCGMVYLPGFYFYNASEATQEEIEESARKLAEHILDSSYVSLSME
jgi:glutathione-regulated potassium-efflux system ancillary protein KefG